MSTYFRCTIVSILKSAAVKAISLISIHSSHIYCPNCVKFSIKDLQTTILHTCVFHKNQRKGRTFFLRAYMKLHLGVHRENKYLEVKNALVQCVYTTPLFYALVRFPQKVGANQNGVNEK